MMFRQIHKTLLMVGVVTLSLFWIMSTYAIPVFKPKMTAGLNAQPVDFVPGSVILSQLNIPTRLAEAVVKIEVVSAEGRSFGVCTAFFISDQGILLSAGHCFEPCLADSVVMHGSTPKIDHSKLSSTTCQIKINDKLIPLKVIATSGCYHTPASMNIEHLNCGPVDWAFVDVGAMLTEPAPCLATTSLPAQFGMDAVSLGFPEKSSRNLMVAKARDADGTNLFGSLGKVIPYQKYCDIDVDDKAYQYQGRNPLFAIAKTPDFKRSVDSGDIIQATVDTLRGDSGGPLLSVDNHQVIAITTLGARGTDLEECKGSSFFSSIIAIKTAVTRDYPELLLSDIFSCPARN